jgi:CheY-like chemotaxis protein
MPTKGHRRILLVDDHDDSRELFRHILESAGHVVTCTGDGHEGLQLLLGGGFNVAILDIALPRIDGRQIAAAARERLAGQVPRLIAVTAYAAPSLLATGTTAGFDAFLLKPVDHSDLLAALDVR